MKKNNYQNWSKEDLVKEVETLKKRKKYGLVWEEKKEDVVEQCKKELPVLKEVKEKEIITDKDKPVNLLIEGDNYHALSVLNYTHKGRVDFIYLDPPYNTGARDWKYDNNYVDSEDGFRHSKWLSFIAKRLSLAKSLLKPDGIITITIDDYEIGPLRLLMDEIYGEENRLGLITIVHNPRGRSDDLYFATSHEYALVYGRNFSKTSTYKLKLTEEQAENFLLEDDKSRYRLLPLKRTGSNSTPKERPNLYFSIYYSSKNNDISLDKKEGYAEIVPLDTAGNKRVWRWGKKAILERKDSEIVVRKGKDGFYSVFAKDRIKEGRKPKTVWVDPKYDASSHGTMLIQKILGERKIFDYPKSIYAVKDLLEVGLKEKKQALVLDFFAGSGTTGHAILELNKEDSGNRKFILCTNNELNGLEKELRKKRLSENEIKKYGICQKVTYPRLEKVIVGYKKNGNGEKVEGLGGNLKYFKTEFIDFDQPTDKKILRFSKIPLTTLALFLTN
ncbi:MAG: type III restriction-modification system methylation subunit [Candidatus Berkelbacteria bacterium Athens1014_28]|uniref:Type III restriction-modification system methylation subunit n=1 Tax=Candidatus Berkelbacteria bacterium Athens1014_28 TaxID=2017145 RepID=A0A554LN66_9BACT|nr:MAG: type III restriction-modification system methylation subunit [Candidatus Berkelbacteria bacterium Athens1014_28]